MLALPEHQEFGHCEIQRGGSPMSGSLPPTSLAALSWCSFAIPQRCSATSLLVVTRDCHAQILTTSIS